MARDRDAALAPAPPPRRRFCARDGPAATAAATRGNHATSLLSPPVHVDYITRHAVVTGTTRACLKKARTWLCDLICHRAALAGRHNSVESSRDGGVDVRGVGRNRAVPTVPRGSRGEMYVWC